MTRPVVCIAQDGHLAIMLEVLDDGMYDRSGLMVFDNSKNMGIYFKACQVFKVLIRFKILPIHLE